MDKILREVAIDCILPAHFQARQVFSDRVIAQLAASMKEVGQNTPLLVRPAAPASGAAQAKDWFELVCGECRLRAAKQLGWTSLWAVVEEMTDEEAALRGMADNEQRQSLDPIERAIGYQRLMIEYNLSQERVSERSGIDASTLSRLLSLLDEPPEIQELLRKGSLTVFHCRSLDRIADRKTRVRVAKEIAQAGMSAKETDKRVQKLIGRREARRSANKKAGPAKPATDYSGFRFRWVGEEVVMRTRNLRRGDSVGQYITDFGLALEAFLRHEPNPSVPVIGPEAVAANAADGTPGPGKVFEPNPVDVVPEFNADAAHVAESLKPLADIMQDLASLVDASRPAKK